jgi:uncharacterized protein (TIGR02679 family)
MNPPPEAAERLSRLLGGPALAALRQRLRRAYEQAAAGHEPTLRQLSGLAPHEAEALQALMGRRPRQAGSMQIDLAALGQRLQAAGLAADLREALERLDGPIVPHAAERSAARAAWAALLAAPWPPALAALLADARGLGLLKRLATGDAVAAHTLCERVARVLAALPAHGQPRARLAALCLGDAHALDDGQPVATLLLATWRRLGDGSDDGTRALWAAQGVAVNELARPALALNLLRAGAGLAPDGEPRYWSLRQLLRQPPAWPLAGRDVFVCENPNMLAIAADALGPRCAPLACTDGMPAAAQRTLLAQLAAAGATLHYHGDFDWAGVAITNVLLRELGARPWRMGAADYRAALPAAVHAPLNGAAVLAAWDAELTAAMQAAGRAIAEEALAHTLLADLAA